MDILAVQEHWLLPTELGNLDSLDEDALYSAVSPMEMDKLYWEGHLVGLQYCGINVFISLFLLFTLLRTECLQSGLLQI